MGKSVNKVIILGNVGKDPDVKFLPTGAAVANFSIATSERYKDKNGEWKDRTEWHNLVAYSKIAEVIRDYVKKGTKLYIEGRLTTRSWDDKDTGKKVYRTEIVVGDISLLGGKSDGEQGGRGGGYEPQSSQYSGYESGELTDDDIPF